MSRNCEAVIAHAKARKAYKGAVIVETVDQISQLSDPSGTPSNTNLPATVHESSRAAASSREHQSCNEGSCPTTGKSKQRKRKASYSEGKAE